MTASTKGQENLCFLALFLLFSMCNSKTSILYSKMVLIYELNHIYQTQMLKPSARRHSRWASIHFAHAASPCSTMHSSLSFLVSGQAQQIFFLGFDSLVEFVITDTWLTTGAGEAFCKGSPPITNLQKTHVRHKEIKKGMKKIIQEPLLYL